ncbi:transposase [Streptomyces sp. NBC_00963]|uniref:IS701 family transposase n=1 Tax=Streptomyces sp. NBC_00963 TaxID=2903697 RepID=UPI0038701A60|nr:transposase [Streptomyces sp. NBC_00963]
MSGVALCAQDVQREAYASIHAGAQEEVLTELCSVLFASLPRRDQRRRGVEYVRGLLAAEGRKSIRNMAALTGGATTEQGLHHFISSSTWDWAEVRGQLARYLVRAALPSAWVVRPMIIPKAGEHSVGVDRRYFPAFGQVLNAQQAFGVWAASDRMSSPVNWRLHLSGTWLDDGQRRVRASIPESLSPEETLGECAIEVCRELVVEQGLPLLPVVLDSRETDAATTVRQLRAAGLPFLIRVSGTQLLAAADATAQARRSELPAYQIMGAAKELRRQAVWTDHGPAAVSRTSLVAALRVALPARASRSAAPEQAGDRRGLLLLGEWRDSGRWPTGLWLTDLTHVQPGALLRLSKLIARVDRDCAEIADQVGVRDYAGRSFGGWHRHITLASAAHAITAVAGAAERQCRAS